MLVCGQYFNDSEMLSNIEIKFLLFEFEWVDIAIMIYFYFVCYSGCNSTDHN